MRTSWPFLEVTGQRFGRLVAVERYTSGKHMGKWLFKCDCGGTRIESVGQVRRSKIKTPGCRACAPVRAAIQMTKHGGSEGGKARRPELYGIWLSMRNRCLSRSHHAYARYGGRGISICAGWLEFQGFAAWAAASGYLPGLSIDRVNNDGNYEPSNCEWVTKAENTRRLHAYHREHGGYKKRGPHTVRS